MKSLLFFFFLLLGTCVPAFAFAPVEPLITRSSVEDSRLALTLANLEQDRTVVQLYNFVTNETLYSKVVRNHNGFSVSLSLKELPEGRYIVCVKKGDTVRRQVILKTEAGIQCSAWK